MESCDTSTTANGGGSADNSDGTTSDNEEDVVGKTLPTSLEQLLRILQSSLFPNFENEGVEGDGPLLSAEDLQPLALVVAAERTLDPFFQEALIGEKNKNYLKNILNPEQGPNSEGTGGGKAAIKQVLEILLTAGDYRVLNVLLTDETIFSNILQSFSPSEEAAETHVKFLSSSKFFPISDVLSEKEEIISRIRSLYRIQYLLSQILNTEANCGFNFRKFDSFLGEKKAELVTSVMDDTRILSSIFEPLLQPDTEEKRREEILLFLKEFADYSKNLGVDESHEFYKTLQYEGLVPAIELSLQKITTSSAAKRAMLTLLKEFIFWVPSAIQEYCQSQASDSENDDQLMLNVIIATALRWGRSNDESSSQLFEILERIMSSSGEMDLLFYSRSFKGFIGNFLEECRKESPENTDLLLDLLKFLGFCLKSHSILLRSLLKEVDPVSSSSPLFQGLALLLSPPSGGRNPSVVLRVEGIQLLKILVEWKDPWTNRMIREQGTLDILQNLGLIIAGLHGRCNTLLSTANSLVHLIAESGDRDLISATAWAFCSSGVTEYEDILKLPAPVPKPVQEQSPHIPPEERSLLHHLLSPIPERKSFPEIKTTKVPVQAVGTVYPNTQTTLPTPPAVGTVYPITQTTATAPTQAIGTFHTITHCDSQSQATQSPGSSLLKRKNVWDYLETTGQSEKIRNRVKKMRLNEDGKNPLQLLNELLSIEFISYQVTSGFAAKPVLIGHEELASAYEGIGGQKKIAKKKSAEKLLNAILETEPGFGLSSQSPNFGTAFQNLNSGTLFQNPNSGNSFQNPYFASAQIPTEARTDEGLSFSGGNWQSRELSNPNPNPFFRTKHIGIKKQPVPETHNHQISGMMPQLEAAAVPQLSKLQQSVRSKWTTFLQKGSLNSVSEPLYILNNLISPQLSTFSDERSGPPHCPSFYVQLDISGLEEEGPFCGKAGNKKEAKSIAAKNALKFLLGNDYDRKC